MEFDFAQNTSVDKLDKVPTDFHGLYKQAGEKFVLDTDHPGVKSAISAITGLNTALKASRTELKSKPTVDLTPLKEFGETPDVIATTVQKQIKDLTEQIKGVNVDKIKQDLATEWSNKLKAKDLEATALQGQLFQTLVVGDATQAIAAAKGEIELLMPFVQKQVKTTIVDGKYKVQVVDTAGDVRYSGVTGLPMSVGELVQEMKANEKFGRLFASESPNGGGGKPGAAARTNKAAGAFQSAEKTATQKISDGLRKASAGGARQLV